MAELVEEINTKQISSLVTKNNNIDELNDKVALQSKQELIKINSRYLIDKSTIFGTGTFSQVVRAIDLQNPRARLVAKIINPKNYSGGKYINFIQLEINCLKYFTKLANEGCPYFSTYYDAYFAQNEIYIFSPQIDGIPLDLCLNGREGFNQTEVLIIGYQIAKAIKIMTENGIFHRDIKLPNILLKNNYSIKIIDPGIGMMLTNEQKQQQQLVLSKKNKKYLIIPCNQAGSKYYIAPEMAQKCLSLDGRSDIYSFGILITILLINTQDHQDFLKQNLQEVQTYTNKFQLNNVPFINFFKKNKYSLNSFWVKLINSCIQINYLHRSNPWAVLEIIEAKLQQAYLANAIDHQKLLSLEDFSNCITLKYLELVEKIEKFIQAYNQDYYEFKFPKSNESNLNQFYDMYKQMYLEAKTQGQLISSLIELIAFFWQFINFGVEMQKFFQKINFKKSKSNQNHQIDLQILQLQLLYYYKQRAKYLNQIIEENMIEFNKNASPYYMKQNQIYQNVCMELKGFCIFIDEALLQQISYFSKQFEIIKELVPVIQIDSYNHEESINEILKQIEIKIGNILPILNKFGQKDIQIEHFSQYLIEFDKMIKQKEGCNYYYASSNINFQNVIRLIEFNGKKKIVIPQLTNKQPNKKVKQN